MIWKLRHFSFQKQTKLTGGSPVALAAAKPSMAAPPETAGLCTLEMIQGKGTRWASLPLPLPLHVVPVNCLALTEADNAAASFLPVCKKNNFQFIQRTENF